MKQFNLTVLFLCSSFLSVSISSSNPQWTPSTLLLGLFGSVARAEVCNNAFQRSDFCYKMRHLQSQIMVLGAQRELNQLNFPYIEVISKEIETLIENLDNEEDAPPEIKKHIFPRVQEMARDLILKSQAKDPHVLSLTEGIEGSCASCHGGTEKREHLEWSHLLNYNWARVKLDCFEPNRGGEICLQMNGLLSAYAGVVTGPNAGRYNFEVLAANMREIIRIVDGLAAKNLFHSTKENFDSLRTVALETELLALDKNDRAFTRAREIPTSCIECHNQSALSRFIPIKFTSPLAPSLEANQNGRSLSNTLTNRHPIRGNSRGRSALPPPQNPKSRSFLPLRGLNRGRHSI